MERVACENRQDKLHQLDPEAHPRTAENGYNIGGRQLLDLVRSFEGDRPATVIYHSHPRVGAYFSQEDTRAALAAGYPVDYLVVDVQEDRVRESVLFRLQGPEYGEIGRFPGDGG
jgi:proteasome lid subunit RPN8/RPN11